MDRHEFLAGLVDQPNKYKTFQDEVLGSQRVYNAAGERFDNVLLDLYCPDMYVLQIHPKAEEFRNELYNEHMIGRYGAYEYNFEFEGELYVVIIVNND